MCECKQLPRRQHSQGAGLPRTERVPQAGHTWSRSRATVLDGADDTSLHPDTR